MIEHIMDKIRNINTVIVIYKIKGYYGLCITAICLFRSQSSVRVIYRQCPHNPQLWYNLTPPAMEKIRPQRFMHSNRMHHPLSIQHNGVADGLSPPKCSSAATISTMAKIATACNHNITKSQRYKGTTSKPILS